MLESQSDWIFKCDKLENWTIILLDIDVLNFERLFDTENNIVENCPLWLESFWNSTVNSIFYFQKVEMVWENSKSKYIRHDTLVSPAYNFD